jgi:hypothetical protein
MTVERSQGYAGYYRQRDWTEDPELTHIMNFMGTPLAKGGLGLPIYQS